MKILIVEDDECVIKILETALVKQHYSVEVATNGLAGRDLAEAFTYDLIVLDIMLPKLDGINVCKQLREQGNHTPILLLTAQDTSTQKVMGLNAGADDYLVKPFDLAELLARIRALLRRGGTSLSPVIEAGDLRLDTNLCQITYGNHLLSLTPKEYGLLELFLRNQRRTFNNSNIIEHLWSVAESPSENTIRAHLKSLRQKLKAVGAPADLIETVYGLGYRLKISAETSAEATESSTPPISALPKSTSDLKLQPESEPKLGTGGEPEQILLDAEIAKVWQRYQGQFIAHIQLLEEAMAALLRGDINAELRQQVERTAHKLAGSLGMFGLHEGTRIAQAIEQLWLTGATRSQVPQLSQWVAQLHQEIQQYSMTQDSSSQSLQSPSQPETQSLVAESAQVPTPTDPAQSLMAAIVASSDDAIIGMTLSGTILSWNAGAEKIYGYAAVEVEGQSIACLIPSNATKPSLQKLTKIHWDQDINHQEARHVRKDG
ncbi:MAG: response regulator, partial [Leptolyngbyaceae bacterium]|nr:response regulator [Leptolyngbyaceae bacterium]